MKNFSPLGTKTCLSLLTLFFVSVTLLAQTNEMYDGIVRIKVDETTASYLQAAERSQTNEGYVVTGKANLDNALFGCKATEIKRVFKPINNAYEAKHQKHGLHLWYEVRFDKAVQVNLALQELGGVTEVQRSEPVYEKRNIGYTNTLKKRVVPLSSAPNDTQFGDQWHYDNTGQTGGTAGADISLLDAWGVETGDNQVIVAVTDGGIDVAHEDIAVNMWVNVNEIPGNGIDDDNNGYIDDINGYGFGDDTGAIPADFHGTHVGGTVAAVTNNGIGVSGVAGGDGSGDGVRLMSLAAFGAVSTGNFEGTYVYAADNGAVISQNSWGYTSPGVFEQVVLDAIDYFIAEAGFDALGNPNGPMQGGLVVFAAGNDGSFSDYYPGFYDPVLAVGGTDHNDDQYVSSNRGPWVDVAAPAVNVLSTFPNNQYGTISGTSMACPHVSGLAGLIVSRNIGGITPDQVRFLIEETTDPLPGLEFLGSGRINAFAALQFNDGAPPDDIINLAVAAVDLSSATLQWTAPADAGSANASTYDIRYSTSAIDAASFDLATAVANPPLAAVAGTLETFAVTGLNPATQYYFAIKSADFFGNISGISNVANATTNNAPLAGVTPASFTSDLITGETGIQLVTISNTGLGPLDFDVSFTEASFLSANTVTGTVAPGGNQDVEITFDASGLFGGIYENDVVITTNDPANPSFTIPATMNVTGTGTPVISVSTASLTFNTLFVGASETLTFEVSNEGTEILDVTDIASNSPDFTVTSATSFSVLPFEIEQVSIQFSPTVLGALSGLLTIANNDTEQQVTVTGIGVEPPVIGVNPTSISAELVAGDSEISVLTISNTGVADLTFDLEIVDAGASTTAEVEMSIPAKTTNAAVSGGNAKQSTSGNFAGMQTLSNVSLTAGELEVLLLTPDDDISDLESTLSAFPDLVVTRFPEASLQGITISDVAAYDIIVTTNNTQWLAGGNVSPEVIGDLLADYIDQGGRVVANCFAYDYDAWAIAGRFINEGYGPFTSTTTDFSGSASLGTIHAPAHPVMVGVSAIGNSYLWQDPSLATGATLLADWGDGNHFAAANDNVVALNILPSDGNGIPGWTGDLATLYHNAIVWLSGPAFVSLDQESGVLATGQSVDVNVTLSAGNLDPGLYEAGINISSNDPVSALTSVPVKLTALGPAVVASPTSFDLTLEKGETALETLTLTNNSKNDATYDISIANGPATSVTMQRTPVPLVPRTEAYSGNLIGETSMLALTTTSPTLLSTEQYGTGFEDFGTGDINGQQGWTGQFGNWAISTSNPSEGLQSLESLSDGLGQTLAFSPEVPIGSDPTSSFSTKIAIQDGGVTWELIPQSTTAALVNTRLIFNPDGSVDALVSDGVGGSSFQTVAATTPSGYFKVDIEVERATSQFTISFDDVEVFSGLGFAGDVEQLVLLSQMEVFGPTLFVDELQILDGPVVGGVPFVAVNPASGIIPTGSSVNLDVFFDSSEQEFGVQEASIVVSVNEGAIDDVVIPTTLNVTGDPAIEIDPQTIIEIAQHNKLSTRTLNIANTGGNPLNYELNVFNAEAGTTTEALTDRLSATRSSTQIFDDRVTAKLSEDNQGSTKQGNAPPTSQYITVGNPIFTEDFEGGTFPPANWTAIDNEGNGVVWSFTGDAGEDNYSGTGDAATISSDAFGPAEFDAELISPAINIAGKTNLVLKYNVSYQNFVNSDFLDLDLSLDGGVTWSNVLSWNEDHGTFRGLPGEQVEIPLDGLVSGATSMMIRWHYYDPNTGDWDWYAQIDDVQVVENSEVWLAVNNTAGSVPVGESAEVELLFDPTVVDPGLYLAGIFVESNAVLNPLEVVLVAMDELDPALISTDPTSLEEELVSGRNSTKILTISNTGESILDFAFEDNFPNVGEVITTALSSTTNNSAEKTGTSEVNLRDSRAISSSFGYGEVQTTAISQSSIEPPVDFSNVLYATNFESFGAGDINGQQGWAGQFANWQIDSANPFGQAQYVRSVSDGLGSTLAFSPEVPIGEEAVSSTSMMVDLEGTGVTWQIIPQSNSEELVVTRLSFDPDGTASVLVEDNGGEFQPISTPIPDGYFEVKIEVDRASNAFIIYFDNAPVFAGTGFAGSIEQVVLLSLMEVADPTMDIDNLQIVDGIIAELPVSVSPTAGSIPSGSTQDIAVRFDATNLAGGVYQEDLVINSNDPVNPETLVGTELVVIDAQIITITPDEVATEVFYKQTTNETLTVTNSGVADLIFHIDVGDQLADAETSHQLASRKGWESDSRIVEKAALDGPIEQFGNNSLVKRQGVVALLQEGFEGPTFPPADWNVIDNAGSGVVWAFAADYGDGNYTGGSGEAATVNSDAFGRAEFDAELHSPIVNTNGKSGLSLQYNVNYQNFVNDDFLDTDISTDGGLTWTTMLRWNEDHGTFFGSPGEAVNIDLDPYLAGATSFMLRWHYYDPNANEWDWYAQIDNVVIGVPWLSLSQAGDTLAQGESVDIDLAFDASLLESGNYTSNLSICSNDLRNPQVEVPVDMLVLTAPQIIFQPDTLKLVVEEDDDDDEIRESFNIVNVGESPLSYNLITTPSFVKIKKKRRRGKKGKKRVDVSGVLNAGESREVKIRVDVDDDNCESGSITGALVFGSNDPINPFAEFVVDVLVQDDDDDDDEDDDNNNDNVVSLTVMPNPFVNYISVSLETKKRRNYDVTIYSLMGEVVYRGRIKSSRNQTVTKQINASSFDPGLYRFVLQSRDGEMKGLTLIK